MKVLELFSGIGGMHYALKEALLKEDLSDVQQLFEVTAVDNNRTANEVYTFNFNLEPVCRNVESLPHSWFDANSFDLLLMSPPCQPFTRLGARKCETDYRCEALIYIVERIRESLSPTKLLLLENVAGFEKSLPREKLIEALMAKGYQVQEFLLTPFQFGIPNSRPRYYLIAKLSGENLEGKLFEMQYLPTEKFGSEQKDVFVMKNDENLSNQFEDQYHLCNRFCDTFHPKVKSLKNILRDASICLDDNLNQYLVDGKIVSKYHVCSEESFESSCFTKGYPRCFGKSGSLMQTSSNEFRYFTEHEISRLLGFPASFNFPKHCSLKQRYALLGNSLCVPVVSHLLYLLLKS